MVVIAEGEFRNARTRERAECLSSERSSSAVRPLLPSVSERGSNFLGLDVNAVRLGELNWFSVRLSWLVDVARFSTLSTRSPSSLSTSWYSPLSLACSSNRPTTSDPNDTEYRPMSLITLGRTLIIWSFLIHSSSTDKTRCDSTVVSFF